MEFFANVRRMVTAKRQSNIKHARESFAEHLDYVVDGSEVIGLIRQEAEVSKTIILTAGPRQKIVRQARLLPGFSVDTAAMKIIVIVYEQVGEDRPGRWVTAISEGCWKAIANANVSKNGKLGLWVNHGLQV